VSILDKTKIKNMLRSNGIRVIGTKVNKEDFRRVFGAKYNEPEWMLLTEHDPIDANQYLALIDQDEKTLNRVVLPSTYSVTKFGDFLTSKGSMLPVVGLVYQYSLAGNPRNVHYAYRLFAGSSNFAKNSGFPSLQEVKLECASEAKKVIETKLFDLR
jgi:hypothetical protein